MGIDKTHKVLRDLLGMPVSVGFVKKTQSEFTSNSKFKLISVSEKRGKEGSETARVLQTYSGTLIHDCWAPYFGFDKAIHALCCAHLLR
jgi:hypothetical protein